MVRAIPIAGPYRKNEWRGQSYGAASLTSAPPNPNPAYHPTVFPPLSQVMNRAGIPRTSWQSRMKSWSKSHFITKHKDSLLCACKSSHIRNLCTHALIIFYTTCQLPHSQDFEGFKDFCTRPVILKFILVRAKDGLRNPMVVTIESKRGVAYVVRSSSSENENQSWWGRCPMNGSR